MGIPTRVLGRTGVHVSAVGLGGYHIGNPSEKDAIAIIRGAIDRGITFLDNCWDYHDGDSEVRMGKALRDGYRQKVFLMTKIDGRTRTAAAEQIDQSLKRLQTDVIDLMQIHEVIRSNDPQQCFAAGGAIEALVEAQRAGKIRFIGFTGHKDPKMHIDMLQEADRHGFAFDALQLPLNVLDHHWNSFEQVLPEAHQRNVAVLGMKPLGAGEILKLKKVSALECLRYALSLPTSVVITGCESLEQVDQAIAAATAPLLTDEEKRELLARTAPLSPRGKHEAYKTTHEHDGTMQSPHWLTSAKI
jgi:aryl-alcohol dehydrogenase-like predicted oxidoreductase